MIRCLLVSLFFMVTITVASQDYPAKFVNVDGWHISGEKQYFSPENLYDYINGASDFYLGYGFEDLWVVDYINASNQLLTLELYRHNNPMLAYGIYSEERPLKANISKTGAQGFVEDGAVFFLAHDYYVKIYNGQPQVAKNELISFSEKVAELICDNCALPQQFDWFPTQNKIDYSERYMAENFMGLTGFDGVCTVEYKSADEKVRLFAFKGADEKCHALMNKYFKRVGYKKKVKAKQYNFNDPYIGKVVLIYDDGIICGLLDAKETGKYQDLLDEMYSKLKME